MYYVNVEQIRQRLEAIPEIADTLTLLAEGWSGSLLEGMAQERALHLAIETVTDIGSFLIDGFIMRDASSYEDLVDIIAEEHVFAKELHEPLMALVKLRKPLVQYYYEWPRTEWHELSSVLPELLQRFKTAVEQYLERELPA
ncbi:protein of unknown function DUF86 [Paenibacillus curdlanolyticus YK9]|uniref:DUF86 domain-containing protein n=1 Tax=Paenibacillus curdlanolyticus YK9 TaxID=717606 RepID=E0I4U1_9BACL|nr:HepT-like ribonuclease domain-containing protein [Paenibacillus curdlanolyticus]EFM12622.1 protein of unknown function DUF86 [Paenibacillus curdlanolyticus YK9]